jgi:hypothetical protein
MYEKQLSPFTTLDFWSKIFPLITAAAYAFGLLLLNGINGYYWGFTDFGIAGALCTAAAYVTALIVASAFTLQFIGNCIIRWFERGNRKWVFFMFSVLSLLLYISTYVWKNSIRAFMQHHFHAPTNTVRERLVAALAYSSSVYILSTTLPAWKTNKPDRTNLILPDTHIRAKKATAFQKAPIWLIKFIFIAIAAVSFVSAFMSVYLLIPVRFGGGKPTPIALWIEPNSELLFETCAVDVPSKTSVQPPASPSNWIVNTDFQLVHDASNYLVLWNERYRKSIIGSLKK